ncbi:hypothetical protein [Streptomyces sp. NRRL S-646]|uniref:hypothetical protein n=1 Tax=Streptomyces sp. NRRL S-646 TaxID=1463917 RepID=UPI0004CC3C5A|nr:hypothetical protein [Streptomyces sp. NRRL S-646]
MPLSPNPSTRVTPSDPDPQPQGYDGSSPLPPDGPVAAVGEAAVEADCHAERVGRVSDVCRPTPERVAARRA